MKTRQCNWKGCKTKIELDTSMESKSSFFTVVGWCDVHQEAFRIYTKLEKKFCEEKDLDWPIGSLTYKQNKKALHQLHILSGHRAEQAHRHGTVKQW